MEAPFREIIKILLLGPSNAGKTSLSRRFSGTYDPDAPYQATNCVDYAVHTKKAPDGADYAVQIYDTAGAERFEPILNAYYRNTHAIFAVVDLAELEYAIAGVDDTEAAAIVRKRLAGTHTALCTYDVSRCPLPVVHVLGSKCDTITDVPLATLRGRAELMRQAAALHAAYSDCSARTNTNATQPFHAVIDAIIAERTRIRESGREALVPRPLAPDWARAPWTESIATSSSSIGNIGCYCCYAQ